MPTHGLEIDVLVTIAELADDFQFRQRCEDLFGERLEADDRRIAISQEGNEFVLAHGVAALVEQGMRQAGPSSPRRRG